MSNDYTGDERRVHPSVYTAADRREDSPVIQLMTEIHGDVKDLRQELTKHMKEETHEIAAEIKRLMMEAFPEGDPKGHRKHHELVIKQAEKRAAFWTDLSASVAKWGLAGFLGWVVVVLWKSVIAGPTQ